jgi:hypothetical protein
MKSHSMTRRYASTDLLRALLQRSEQAKLTRLPTDEFWAAVDPDGKHVLKQVIPFEPRCVRTFALCKMLNTMEPAILFLDFCREDWELLPPVPQA